MVENFFVISIWCGLYLCVESGVVVGGFGVGGWWCDVGKFGDLDIGGVCWCWFGQ